MPEPARHFPHAMLREIYEQPEALQRVLEAYTAGGALQDHAFAPALIALQQLAPREDLLIAASGSSRHAGLVGKSMLAEIASFPAEVQYASEYIGQFTRLTAPRCALVLSQSGETADTLEAMRKAESDGAAVIAITNKEASSMATAAAASLSVHAGLEKAIPATKSFTTQLLVLYLLSVAAGEQQGRLTTQEVATHLAAANQVPSLLRGAMPAWEAQIRAFLPTLSEVQTFLFLGRGPHFAIASEGALKMKESAYVQAEGYPSGELKHGPNALVSHDVMLVVLATQDPADPGSTLRYGKTLQLLRDLRAQGARTLALVSAGDTEAPPLCGQALIIPATAELLAPILEVVPLQMLAYLLSVERGIDVDRPRNLVKSVVRE